MTTLNTIIEEEKTPTTSTEGWEKEFDAADLQIYGYLEGFLDRKKIKSFITQLLSTQQSEVIRVVEREIQSTENGEVLSYLERIKERIQTLTPKQ